MFPVGVARMVESAHQQAVIESPIPRIKSAVARGANKVSSTRLTVMSNSENGEYVFSYPFLHALQMAKSPEVGADMKYAWGVVSMNSPWSDPDGGNGEEGFKDMTCCHRDCLLYTDIESIPKALEYRVEVLEWQTSVDTPAVGSRILLSHVSNWTSLGSTVGVDLVDDMLIDLQTSPETIQVETPTFFGFWSGIMKGLQLTQWLREKREDIYKFIECLPEIGGSAGELFDMVFKELDSELIPGDTVPAVVFEDTDAAITVTHNFVDSTSNKHDGFDASSPMTRWNARYKAQQWLKQDYDPLTHDHEWGGGKAIEHGVVDLEPVTAQPVTFARVNGIEGFVEAAIAARFVSNDRYGFREFFTSYTASHMTVPASPSYRLSFNPAWETGGVLDPPAAGNDRIMILRRPSDDAVYAVVIGRALNGGAWQMGDPLEPIL
jgi:hypothetical protein